MRIVVFGAGAIGSTLAAQLALAGANVAVIARGAHLAALQQNGLAFTPPSGNEQQVRLEAGADVPPGDIVLVTLKSHALSGAAASIKRVTRDGGLVVFLQNGLPWWFFRGRAGPSGGKSVAVLDPSHVLASAFAIDEIAGGVVTISATMAGPGQVHHSAGWGISLGRADANADERLSALSKLLATAGFEVALPGDPRPAVWIKLVVNASINGVAALTGANIGTIWDDDLVRPIVHRLADEVMQIGAALNCPVSIDLEARRRNAARTHKSSTLQDIEAGRPIEYEALFGSLLQLANELNVPVPTLTTVSSLLRRKAIESHCLP